MRSALHIRSSDLIKNIFQLELSKCRTLHVFDCTKLSRHALAIFPLYWRHSLLRQLVLYLSIFPKIYLSTDDQAGHSRAVMVDLGKPLLAYILERSRGCDGEADEEDISLGIREGSETVVIFLSGSIKETEGVGLITNPLRNQHRFHRGIHSKRLARIQSGSRHTSRRAKSRGELT